MSYSENWYPVSFDTSDTQSQGFALDIHRSIFKDLGITLTLAPDIPWKRQLKLLELGNLDAIAAINFNQERATKFILSDSFHSFNVRAFTLKTSKASFTKLEDLNSFKVAYSRGASFGEKFNALAESNPDFFAVNGTDTIVEMLLGKRIDFIILPEILGVHLLTQKNVLNKTQMTGPIIHSQPVHLAFSKKSDCSEVVEAYNKKLNQLKTAGTLSKFVSRY